MADFLAWLVRWPSPWDLFATLAALGSWFVAWRQFRASQKAEKPIFAASMSLREDGAFLVNVSVTNREDHPLRITQVQMLGGGLCAVARHSYDVATGTTAEVLGAFQRTMAIRQDFKAAGNGPTIVGRTRFGHGDTGSFEFVATAPAAARSLAFRLTAEPVNADLRPFTKKIVVRKPPPASTA